MTSLDTNDLSYSSSTLAVKVTVRGPETPLCSNDTFKPATAQFVSPNWKRWRGEYENLFDNIQNLIAFIVLFFT